jgi:hypothetical protein
MLCVITYELSHKIWIFKENMVQTIAERKHWTLSLKTNSQTNIPIDRLEANIKMCFRVACYSKFK